MAMRFSRKMTATRSPSTQNNSAATSAARSATSSFFSAAYEGTLINNPNPIFERVPTTADISSAGPIQQSRTTCCRSSPDPTCRGAGTGTFGFYKGTAPNYTHVHNIFVRPDIDLGRKGQVSIRYAGQLLDQLHDDSLPEHSPGGYPGNGADRKAQNQSVALVHTLPFANGKSVNEARLAFTQYRVDEVGAGPQLLDRPP